MAQGPNKQRQKDLEVLSEVLAWEVLVAIFGALTFRIGATSLWSCLDPESGAGVFDLALHLLTVYAGWRLMCYAMMKK